MVLRSPASGGTSTNTAERFNNKPPFEMGVANLSDKLLIPFASHLSKILNISGNTVWRNFLNWKESSGRVRVADHLLPYIPGGVAGVDQAYRVKKGSDS